MTSVCIYMLQKYRFTKQDVTHGSETKGCRNLLGKVVSSCKHRQHAGSCPENVTGPMAHVLGLARSKTR